MACRTCCQCPPLLYALGQGIVRALLRHHAIVEAEAVLAELAFAWLEKAARYGDPGLSEMSVTPEFDSIRDDPRWEPFLEKIGKSPKRLAAIEFHPSLPDQG